MLASYLDTAPNAFKKNIMRFQNQMKPRPFTTVQGMVVEGSIFAVLATEGQTVATKVPRCSDDLERTELYTER